MAFSQSFDFGDTTFMNLENELNRASSDRTSQKISNKQAITGSGLEIIQESPPNKSFRSQRVNRTQTTRKNFRRSKSDSKFEVPAAPPKTGNASENYSEFFKDEFSYLEVSAKQASKKSESMVRISQIMTDFDDAALEDTSAENAFSVFEAQICTEDVLEAESTESNFNASNRKSPIISRSTIKAEEFNDLDESCFICPARDTRASQQLQQDLLRSRCEMALVTEDRPKQTQNLSSMSPNQLQISPTCPIPTKETQPTTETSTPTLDPKDLEALKHISAWNLPHSVLSEYNKKGVIKMFDWQVECLSKPKVLFEHCNLVYSAPTSAGKTLVSEILLLKTVLERGKKVLLILPFISVVREKMFYLQDLLTPAGYRVEGFFGGYTPPGGFESIHVAICTIEKANSIVNKLLEQGKLDEIGTVVVDEVHLISDPGRGYILELLLAKVMYMSRKHALEIQIITMSATLANVKLLQRWLDAELYITDFRPVALQEMIKVGNKIYDNQLQFLRDITETSRLPPLGNDSDHVAQLCIETLLEGCSVIVFCPSKDWCENLAVQLATAMHALIKSGSEVGQKLRAQLNTESIQDVKQQLKDIPTGLDAVMGKAVTYACAFHHAGLTTEERDIVEASFKSGALKVIVATSTLSSGVNLPARRVLIRSPLFGGKQMSSLTYRQMIGRAGRTGKDTLGESILICTDNNARIGRELITADLKPISSCLELDSSTHLKRALLEVISSGVASSIQDINTFVNCTLLSAQKALAESADEEETDYISDALDFLVEYEFVRLQTDEETETQRYVATRLGCACLASSMPPTDGLILFAELQKARRCFVLESELHAVYLVTPYSVCYQLQDLDWLLYLDMWEKLSPAMKKVGELVGIKEQFLVRAMRNRANLDYKLMQIHKRFYTALALQELVNETPINVVGHKFKCARGMLQSLQQMASTFAGIVTAFCNSLQWSTLSLVVSQFKERLYFGIHRDLIDLMRLPDLSHKRARALFDAGITSLVELAHADVLNVEKVLFNSLSFDSAKQLENEDAFEAAQRNAARNFFITGKAGMTVGEAARLMITQARQFVQYEIGVDNIKWTQQDQGAKGATDSGMEVELHMSLEEEKKQRVSNENRQKRTTPLKDETPRHVSPPKLRKLEQPISDSKLLTNAVEKRQQRGSKITQNTVVSSVEILPRDMAVNKNDQKKDLDKTQTTKKSNDNINSNTRGKSVKEKEETNEKLKINTRSEKKITGDSSQYSTTSNGKKTENLQYKSQVQPNYTKNNETPSNPKEPVVTTTTATLKVDPAVLETNPIIPEVNTQSARPKPTPSVASEKASTSVAVRKELLMKEIAERRRIALMKMNKKRAELDNVRQGLPKDTPIKTQSVSNKENADSNNMTKSFKTPITNPKPVTPKSAGEGTKANGTSNQLPRRSPRNHQSTKKEAENDTRRKTDTAVEQDLFMEEDSFMLNTGLTAALTAAESKARAKASTDASTISNSDANTDADEIPSSQPKDDLQSSSKSVFHAQTPHASRLMRSYQLRTQRLQSPIQTNKSPPVPAPVTNEPEQHSSSIEMSDMSLENSLIKHPLQLNASHILSCSKVDDSASSFRSIDVIDICGNQKLFHEALKELHRAQRLGMSVGLQHQAGKSKPIIGANLLLNQMAAAAQREAAAGTKILFQVDDNSFIACLSFCVADNVVYYMDMQQDEIVSSELKVQQLCRLLTCPDLTLIIHDGKEQLKTLRHALPQLQNINVKMEDPKVGNWLLQPDKTLSFQNMTQQFAPECTALAQLCGSGRGYSSYGLDASNAILPKVRASIEACVSVHILKGQVENLERIGTGQLLKFFRELEMPLQVSLCQMECLGFPAKEHRLQRLFQQMLNTMKKLEAKIYELHGSRFNLGSTQAVAKVLGLHRKTNGRVSTSRQILEKLDSPISQLILNYRKLAVTLSKNMQPLLKCCESNRIHGQSITYTATGRISMSEPNLQNVAKDFDVEVGGEKIKISCRSAFAPMNEKRCLLSADFCQLEMRILAHLSQDAALLSVMKSPQDLFSAIAAHWNKIPESEVSEQLRNGTKQICYGIVYGMGMRSLAESLKCTEQEAQMISEQFHVAYAGIRAYTVKVVKFARNNGYVETITGRRRYLDHINSGEPHLKSQAERQAINSTVQGSAADIAKSAILRMEKNIERYREKLGLEKNAVNLVLHLHDELIFEVPTDKAKKIAKVLRLTMENCVKLNVPLKVKLKIGRSWGELEEVKV
ncbi:DNA polymerase theta [Scaptodrosophila lebanonensis]|uniref:DNA polymerase theta n=1 Tax=Drosophila lebanonensis TaxID=7225 RepID=A0A6J2T653_DROLE|nr:DNA polymerase theta [Scaptodrosophila lebanonensis]